jgi:hypothetical protein
MNSRFVYTEHCSQEVRKEFKKIEGLSKDSNINRTELSMILSVRCACRVPRHRDVHKCST